MGNKNSGRYSAGERLRREKFLQDNYAVHHQAITSKDVPLATRGHLASKVVTADIGRKVEHSGSIQINIVDFKNNA